MNARPTFEVSQAIEQVAARYAVAITPAMVELIDAAEPADPIARQFLPSPAELIGAPNELDDPIGDDVHTPVAGLIHRYPDRVLLKLTHTCAVYCRFCFRREVVGPDGAGNLGAAALEAAMAYIAARPAIWEVILSGGDPLVLSPRRIRAVMAALAAIDHVKVVRIHTRVPAVDPEAVSPEMVEALRCPGKAVYVALHANHARELTPAARAACARLVDAGFPMLGQTVLLAGVNDDPEVLGALMRAMVETRIKPYYLHHADLAPGTGHFRTTIAEGRAVMRAMRGALSGLCQPTYVLDIPGGHGKVPIGPDHIIGCEGGGLRIEDPNGVLRDYAGESADNRIGTPIFKGTLMVKVAASSLRKGNVVEVGGKLYVILKLENIHPGKGTPVTQLDMRRISDGVKVSERWRTTESVEKAFVDERSFNFLYKDGEGYHFMNPDSYDQIVVSEDVVGDMAVYLQDGMTVTLLTHEDVALSLDLPARVTLEVVETEPVTKGQTASGSYKPAILSNGVRSMVPTYVTAGTRIVVMTEDGSFLERAKD